MLYRGCFTEFVYSKTTVSNPSLFQVKLSQVYSHCVVVYPPKHTYVKKLTKSLWMKGGTKYPSFYC